MKEITRINIARTAYDIEPDAKKELGSYVGQLEKYAENKDTLMDIEVRITELLAERGVEPNGVITSEDVKSVREKLGEPSDFAREDADYETLELGEGTSAKRIYRDTNNAILGGVCSGFARYFSIDVVWVRLIFIIILMGSFGTAFVIYLILWAIIPPATTATEKLQMEGQPVTLESIKKFSAQPEPPVNKSAQTFKRVLTIGAGIVLVISAVISLIVTITVPVKTYIEMTNNHDASGGFLDASWTASAVALFTISGLLFTALCLVLANSLFRKVWNKKILVSVILIIVAGMMTFGSGIAVISFGFMQRDAKINSLRTSTRKDLPENFANIKTLSIVDPSNKTDQSVDGQVSVDYVVSTKSYYEFESFAGVVPKIDVEESSQAATISIVNGKSQSDIMRGYSNIILTIYGPEIETINVDNYVMNYYNANLQNQLSVNIQNGMFTLAGQYSNLNLVTKNGSQAYLKNAAIESLKVELDGGRVQAAVVQNLSVVQPTACAVSEMSEDSSAEAELSILAVSSGIINFNGQDRPAQSIEENCGEIDYGKD